MYKEEVNKTIDDTLQNLKSSRISIYKISQIIDEPKSTLCHIFNKGETKYSEERVMDILDEINMYLEGLDISKAKDKARKWFDVPDNFSGKSGSPEIFENTDTYTKLYELGLNSKLFTPAEKLHLALMYKTITDYKNQLIKQNQTPNGDEKNSDNSESFKASRETFGSEAGVHSRDT